MGVDILNYLANAYYLIKKSFTLSESIISSWSTTTILLTAVRSMQKNLGMDGSSLTPEFFSTE